MGVVDFKGAVSLELKAIVDEREEDMFQRIGKSEAIKKRWYRFFFRK